MSQVAAKSDVVNVILPHGTSVIEKGNIERTVHTNFKRTSIPFDKENYFQSDGLIISFWDDKVNPEFNRKLDDIQPGILAVLKYNHDQVNFSKIITVNGMRFLIYEYEKDNEVDLRFQSEFDKNNRDVLGVIQFKKPNEERGQQYLQQLLQNMYHKD
jgi:hypothetical protein